MESAVAIELVEPELNSAKPNHFSFDLRAINARKGGNMTKMIRNLSFGAFLAAASLNSSVVRADHCEGPAWEYCLWGPGANGGTDFGCTSPPITCNFMAECCSELCEEDQMQVSSYSCQTVESTIAGNCTCA